tara:strand:+ start:1268 stop:1456 length:189 start_codon:yes stop_codon:yes gene_type:complete
MTGDTLRASRAGFMLVVRSGKKCVSLMTGLTKRVTWRFQLGGMRVMAVGTGNPGLVHLALQE